MRVNHNIPALYAYNSVNATNRGMQKAIEKLSSGLRINSAADDAAGLAISEKMRGQVRGLDQAMGNAQDGINMIQTAEGALSETHSILQRMRELSVNAANDTLTANDRQAIQLEIDQLTEEVDRISNTTQFNKKKLLNGDAAALWSTDSLDTKVTVRGGLRTIDQFGQKSSAEGNYKIKIDAEAGVSQIQKTDIFKVKHASTGGGEATTSRIDNAAELDLGKVSGFLNKSEANDIQKVLLRVTESAGGSNLFTEVTVSIEATSNMKGADVLDQLASKLTDALNNAGGNFGNLNFSVDTVNGVLVASVAAGAFAFNFSDFSANYTNGKNILNDTGASVQMQGAFLFGAIGDFVVDNGATATVG
ncbi:MAG: flagellin, partial [Synergistales bacterium]|nr:flagellin [Synergistales bacterium]